jgi:serine/threonine protein kinase
MEYVPGGDFRTLMNNSGVLKEEYARFYISEMFMAVNELHKLGYIHRDLKPEVCIKLLKILCFTHFSRRTFSLTVQAM